MWTSILYLDYVSGKGFFEGMTAGIVNLWPMLGLENHTGTHLGIDAFHVSCLRREMNMYYESCRESPDTAVDGEAIEMSQSSMNPSNSNLAASITDLTLRTL